MEGMKRALIAVVLAHTLAGVAAAQELGTAEYGRASGGELQLGVKTPKNTSGTLGFDFGNSAKGYGATFGGTLIPDRIWFFGSVQRNEAFFGKADAQIGDRQNLSAAAGSVEAPGLEIPTSFLSLRYTGIVSSNTFFTVNVSRNRGH
jgi:hypothetical protein